MAIEFVASLTGQFESDFEISVDHPFELGPYALTFDEVRSFVTTGPVLLAKLGGEHPGPICKLQQIAGGKAQWLAEVVRREPLARFEVSVSGEVRQRIEPNAARTPRSIF